MSACLISDLHLQENRPELTKAFKKFLVSHAANVDSLYILGDLFEAWIGDDYENDFITEVKFELKKYSSLGKKIYLMHGNRDFLLGDKFCDEIGGVLLDDPTTIKIKPNGEVSSIYLPRKNGDQHKEGMTINRFTACSRPTQDVHVLVPARSSPKNSHPRISP